MKKTVGLTLFLLLSSCNYTSTSIDTSSTPSLQQDKNTTIQESPLKVSNSNSEDSRLKISFAHLQQYLPKELAKNCVSYKAGCNSCGLDFFNGKFIGYSCTEIGCSPEPYKCLYEHSDDFYTIPQQPEDLNFPENYSLITNCASIMNNKLNEVEYYSLDFQYEGFQWSSDIVNIDYSTQKIIGNKDFLDFLGETSLCLGDIYGNNLLQHSDNLKIFNTFSDFQKQKEVQLQKNNKICLNYHQDCQWTSLYYRPENSKPASKYGGLKTYSNNIPNCTQAKEGRVCQIEISEFKLNQKQEEFDSTILNTEIILRDRSVCFSRIGKIENTCVRYESECETCEILLDPLKLSWRWDFQSKGCTQKYIKEQGGLPTMECAAYQE